MPWGARGRYSPQSLVEWAVAKYPDGLDQVFGHLVGDRQLEFFALRQMELASVVGAPGSSPSRGSVFRRSFRPLRAQPVAARPRPRRRSPYWPTGPSGEDRKGRAAAGISDAPGRKRTQPTARNDEFTAESGGGGK